MLLHWPDMQFVGQCVTYVCVCVGTGDVVGGMTEVVSGSETESVKERLDPETEMVRESFAVGDTVRECVCDADSDRRSVMLHEKLRDCETDHVFFPEIVCVCFVLLRDLGSDSVQVLWFDMV